MQEEAIRKVLKSIESWIMMSCEGCAMKEKITPLLEEIRRLLENEGKSEQPPASKAP